MFDDVACSGSEQRLIDCPDTSLHNCEHSEDAGVESSLTSGSFCIAILCTHVCASENYHVCQ